MSEETKPKSVVRKRRRRKVVTSGGISVSIRLRGVEREIKLECHRRFTENGFFIFLSPGEFGKVIRKQFAIADVVSLEVEEPFVYEQPQAQTFQQPQPQVVTNPVLSSRRGLQAGLTGDGLPVSQLEDGTVVPAGFLS